MNKAMTDPIEQRVRELELRIEFIKSWKSSSFIQITLPILITIFLAAMSWLNIGLSSIDKRIDSVDRRINNLQSKLDGIGQE